MLAQASARSTIMASPALPGLCTRSCCQDLYKMLVIIIFICSCSLNTNSHSVLTDGVVARATLPSPPSLTAALAAGTGAGSASRQDRQRFPAAARGVDKVWQEEQAACSLPWGCAGSHLSTGVCAVRLPPAVPGDAPRAHGMATAPALRSGAQLRAVPQGLWVGAWLTLPVPAQGHWGHVHGAGGGDRSCQCSASELGPLCRQRCSGTGSADTFTRPFHIALWRFRDNKLLISSYPLLGVLCSNAPIINYKLQY